MKLEDVDRETVEEALSERVGSVGHLGVQATLLAYMALRLERIEAALSAEHSTDDVITLLQSIRLSLGLPRSPQDDGLRGDVRRLIETLNLGEADLDVSLASVLDNRTAQAVVALNEILDELRRDRRDELIESILEEAADSGLLGPGAGLPEEWGEEPEEPEPPSGEAAQTAEDGDSAYKQVKTELETFLRNREVDIENPAGHHRGELREYSAEKLAIALTDKLVGMKLQ